MAVLGALVLLLGAAGSAEAAPTISGLEVRPGHFSPDGDGDNDTAEVLFTPVGAESLVTVDVTVVEVAGGTTVANLLAGAVRPSGVLVQATWAPGTAADGRYRFDIAVADSSGTAADAAEVTADSTPPVVTLQSFSQSPFDPDQAALSFQVAVQSDSGTVTRVSVLLQGAEVDSLAERSGPGTTTVSWDGRLAGGTAAPSGRYEILAAAGDLAGNTGEDRQSVTLDRDDPQLQIDTGDSVQTTSFPVSITGVATDDDRVATVEVSFDDGMTFVPADSAGASADTVGFSVSVADSAPVPGVRDVVFRATDAFGHVTEETVVVAYDTVMPVAVSTRLVDADGVLADGDSVEVETIWNASGFGVTGLFGDIDTSIGPQFVADEGGGIYRVLYRISPTNTRPPGPRNIVVRAASPNGFLSARDTVAVTLVDRHGEQLVTVDRNRFDPVARETVTIAASGALSPVAVEIFSLSGRRVRVLEGSGTVEWDGLDDEGRPAGSGVYLLKVQVDGAEEVRKVAVLRGGSR